MLKQDILDTANKQAIYNLFLYLIPYYTPYNGESLGSALAALSSDLKKDPLAYSDRALLRLKIFAKTVEKDSEIALTTVSDLACTDSGLCAAAFSSPTGIKSVAFRGTGSGEWIDNGEGLSGIPEENTYFSYSKDQKGISKKTISSDFASDQQVEALNFFRRLCAKHGWDSDSHIILSGHSKGGNKAQFVAMHSPECALCISFDGQGFSPEAIESMKEKLGSNFDAQRQKIYSLSADNDYVNILGKRLMDEDNIYFFTSSGSFHFIESILSEDGTLLPESDQGKLSEYVKKVSDRLMRLPPKVRQYATLGVMNIFQQYLGQATPVNGDYVSLTKTVAGIAVALGSMLAVLGDL